LEKYTSGTLIPGLADILGLELGGIGQPRGEYEKDKGGGGWDAQNPYSRPRRERNNWNLCVAMELARESRVVWEYVQHGKYVSAEKWRTNHREIAYGKKDDVWDDFDDEEELARNG